MDDDKAWNEPGECVCGWKRPTSFAIVHEDPDLIPNDVVFEFRCPICDMLHVLGLRPPAN